MTSREGVRSMEASNDKLELILDGKSVKNDANPAEDLAKGAVGDENPKKCPGIKNGCCCKCEDCHCIEEKGICDCCKCCQNCDCTGSATIRLKSQTSSQENRTEVAGSQLINLECCCKCIAAKGGCDCCSCCERCKCMDFIKEWERNRVSEWCVVGLAGP